MNETANEYTEVVTNIFEIMKDEFPSEEQFAEVREGALKLAMLDSESGEDGIVLSDEQFETVCKSIPSYLRAGVISAGLFTIISGSEKLKSGE